MVVIYEKHLTSGVVLMSNEMVMMMKCKITSRTLLVSASVFSMLCVNGAYARDNSDVETRRASIARQFVKKGEGGGESSKEESGGGEGEHLKRAERVAPKTVGFGDTKRDKDGKLMTAEGKPLPKHIQAVYIAPAYKDVKYNKNPKGDILVVARSGRKSN